MGLVLSHSVRRWSHEIILKPLLLVTCYLIWLKTQKMVYTHLAERSSTKDGWGNGWEEQDCPDNHNPGSAGSQHFGILDLCYLLYGGRETWTKRQDYTFNLFQLSATEVVEWWYNEAAFHDYHSESQNSRSGKLEQRDEWPVRLVSICSGNFSQMIWSASKALGVGYGR